MLQYYQLKHGFKAVLEDWQLAKIRPIFKVALSTHCNILQSDWSGGYTGHLPNLYHHTTLPLYQLGDCGPPEHVCWAGLGPVGTKPRVPAEHSELQIQQISQSWFVDSSLTENVRLIEFSSNAGLYPHYLWLFKDILSELRHQFTFYDHLVTKVEF